MLITIRNVFVAVISLTCVHLQAQSGIACSGGSATGEGGSVSFSVGVVAYHSQSTELFTIIHGLQHAFPISPLSTEEEPGSLVRIFPNPTASLLQIDLGAISYYNSEVFVNDLRGVQVYSYKPVSSISEISIDFLPAGMYLLTIFREKQIINSFKLIKLS